MLTVDNFHADVVHRNAGMILQQRLLQISRKDDAWRVVAVHRQRHQICVAVNVILHPLVGVAVIGGHFIKQIQPFVDFVIFQPRKDMHPICADVGRHPRIIHRDHRVGGIKLSGLIDVAMHLKFEHLAQTRIEHLQAVVRSKFINGGYAGLP